MSSRFVQPAEHMYLAGTGPVVSVRALERQLGVTAEPSAVRRSRVQAWLDEGPTLSPNLALSLDVAGFVLPPGSPEVPQD